MYRLLLVVALLLALLSSGSPVRSEGASASQQFAVENTSKGVSVLLYWNWNPSDFTIKTRLLLDHLSQIGVNSVSMVFPYFQKTLSSNEVYADERTIAPDRVRIFIR